MCVPLLRPVHRTESCVLELQLCAVTCALNSVQRSAWARFSRK